jgi:hypothetical protein
VFTVLYALSPYMTQTHFIFKGLMLLKMNNIKLLPSKIFMVLLNAMRSAIIEHKVSIKGTEECILILFMTHVNYFYKLCEKVL